MKHAMLTVIRNVPQVDRETGKVIGTNQQEATKAMPHDATLAEVSNEVFALGSNKVAITFETPTKKTNTGGGAGVDETIDGKA